MEARKIKATSQPSFLTMAVAPMEVERLHLMFDHQIIRGVLQKRRWGSIFIKGVSRFEAKKVINHQLEAHGYGGGEKNEEDDDDGGVCWWRKIRGGEEDKVS